MLSSIKKVVLAGLIAGGAVATLSPCTSYSRAEQRWWRRLPQVRLWKMERKILWGRWEHVR